MNEAISRRALLRGGAALAGGLLLSESTADAQRGKVKRVVVWSEGTAPKNVYPNDINAAIAEGLKPLKGWEVVTASINDPDQGLSDELLSKTDVLVWWGHQRHGDVKDELVAKIVNRVKNDGMGFIATHSAHYAKPLQAVLGTNCGWKYYIEDGAKLDMLVTEPKHPIAKGVKNFVIPHTERYGDPFEIPKPDAWIFNGKYTLADGKQENAQQGMVWKIGKGRVFYFQPGHETYPIYFMEEVRRIFRNGVQWVAAKK